MSRKSYSQIVNSPQPEGHASSQMQKISQAIGRMASRNQSPESACSDTCMHICSGGHDHVVAPQEHRDKMQNIIQSVASTARMRVDNGTTDLEQHEICQLGKFCSCDICQMSYINPMRYMYYRETAGCIFTDVRSLENLAKARSAFRETTPMPRSIAHF